MRWILFFCISLMMMAAPSLLFYRKGSVADTHFLDKNVTEACKGFAIFIILLSHSMQLFAPEVTFFTPLGGIGVAIFLMLSGYGINESWERRLASHKGYDHEFWRKRIITVLIPYVIYQTATYWLWNDFSLSGILLDFTCISPMHPFGLYLSFILLCYAVYYIVRRVTSNDIALYAVFVIFGFYCLFFRRSLVAEQSFSFLLGICLSKNKARLKSFFKPQYGAVLMLFGIMMLAVKQLPVVRGQSELILKIIQILIKVPVASGVIIVMQNLLQKISLPYLVFVGSMSFEIYLCHAIVLKHVPATFIGCAAFYLVSGIVSFIYYWMVTYITSRCRVWLLPSAGKKER